MHAHTKDLSMECRRCGRAVAHCAQPSDVTDVCPWARLPARPPTLAGPTPRSRAAATPGAPPSVSVWRGVGVGCGVLVHLYGPGVLAGWHAQTHPKGAPGALY